MLHWSAGHEAINRVGGKRFASLHGPQVTNPQKLNAACVGSPPFLKSSNTDLAVTFGVFRTFGDDGQPPCVV